MTMQIAVRLPDEQVRFLDSLVAEGGMRSRAEVISRTVARLQRQHRALADLEKIRAQPYEEFEAFHHAALASADLDD